MIFRRQTDIFKPFPFSWVVATTLEAFIHPEVPPLQF